MSKTLSILFLLFLLTSCSGDDNGTGGDGGGGSDQIGNIGLENDPTLTAGRDKIYFAVNDTTATDEDGIYVASIANPLKQRLVAGSDLSSPSMSPGKNKLAFLQSGNLRFYDVSSKTVIDPGITVVFKKVCFIDDGYIIGSTASNVLFYDAATYELIQVLSGRDVTYYKPDTAIYIDDVNSHYCTVYQLILHKYHVDTPYLTNYRWYDFATDLPMTNLSVEPSSERVVYHIKKPDGYYLYSSRIGVQTRNFIALSQFDEALIVDYNKIIYVADDNYIYVTDYTGNFHTLFRGAAQ